MVDFYPGDIVEYELSWDGYARWRDNIEHGSSKHWEQAEVLSVNRQTNIMATRGHKTHTITMWPLEGHEIYQIDQWILPGYLRLVSPAPKNVTCECGAAKIYGAANKAHSHWCPAHEE